MTLVKTNIFIYVTRAFLRFIYVVLNNLYCIPTYGVWMVTLSPLLHFNPELFWYIEGIFFKHLLLMVASWGWTAGYRCIEVGEDISSCYNQECLVIANHQSTADVPSFMAAFQEKNQVLPRIVWIMDRMFKFTNFGVVSYIHGDFFIQSGKNSRDSELVRLRDHLLDVLANRKRQWIVLFPEGGFLRKRRETSQKYARKYNYPVLEHVSLPRIGALNTIVNTLHPTKLNAVEDGGCSHASSCGKKMEPLKWIVDITVGYPNGKPVGLPTIVCMLEEPCNIYLHYRRFPIEEVPLDTEGQTKWLYDRFKEKEELLSEFYRTGVFPTRPSAHSKLLDSPKPIIFDIWFIAFMNILFIISSIFHYWLLSRLLSVLWPF